MKYAKLGKSDLNVSRICMGCMGFGNASIGQHSWTLDEAQTREIIKHGLDLGINFYDTAIAYQNGTSEQYVGKALRDFAKRDDYVIATKFTPRTQEEIDGGVSGQKHIENYLNQSLSNLGMDYVDLYIYHMWDYHTPMEEIMDGLNRVGGAVRLLQDDIPKRIYRIKTKYNMDKVRYLNKKVEITSRMSSYEIPNKLRQLEATCDSKDCLDTAVATNMIAVGMDVDRLGLMVVTGQPKQNSEYIQATSRIGRAFPGLVFTLYNPYRPRDLSHDIWIFIFGNTRKNLL